MKRSLQRAIAPATWVAILFFSVLAGEGAVDFDCRPSKGDGEYGVDMGTWCAMAMSERDAAVEAPNTYLPRSSSQEAWLGAVKGWIATNAVHFVTNSVFPASVSNQNFYGTWSITDLVTAVGAPGNYWVYSPHCMTGGGSVSSNVLPVFTEADYGYKFMTNIFARLTRIQYDGKYWDDAAVWGEVYIDEVGYCANPFGGECAIAPDSGICYEDAWQASIAGYPWTLNQGATYSIGAQAIVIMEARFEPPDPSGCVELRTSGWHYRQPTARPALMLSSAPSGLPSHNAVVYSGYEVPVDQCVDSTDWLGGEPVTEGGPDNADRWVKTADGVQAEGPFHDAVVVTAQPVEADIFEPVFAEGQTNTLFYLDVFPEHSLSLPTMPQQPCGDGGDAGGPDWSVGGGLTPVRKGTIWFIDWGMRFK